MSKKPELTIDMGLLDWTPEERKQAGHIAETSTDKHDAIRQENAKKHRVKRKQDSAD